MEVTMRFSYLLTAGVLGLALLGGGNAQALTYDTHLPQNGNSANLFEQQQDDQSGFHVNYGESQDDGYPNAPGAGRFLGSSDHNFSAPDPTLPFGGMIQGEDNR
jgi:hypothetical protein